MQSAYRPTRGLVFFGNETRPSAVGLDVRFWFQAMTFMLDRFPDPVADGRPITPRAFKCGFRSIRLGPVSHSKRILAIIPLSSCFRR